MSVVNTIERLAKWAGENICEKVRLKLPAEDSGNESYNQRYELVTPAAFAMFVPENDRLPPGVKSNVPSLCVRLLEGSDSLTENKGRLRVQMGFSAWDTGCHGKDIFRPKVGDPGAFEQPPPQEAAGCFTRSGDGWRDAWNFVDTALRAIESAETMDGIHLVKEEGIQFGPLKEQEAIPDLYPLWFAWLTFTVEYPIARSHSWDCLL